MRLANIFLVIGINLLFLNSTIFAEDLCKQAEDKINVFSIYGKRAQNEIIPLDWQKKHLYFEMTPFWAVWVGEEDKERGYLVFKKNYLDLIYPDTLPEGEIGESLEIFATPGEYEPVTFCIKALKDIKSFRVNVSDLINKGEGSVIDKNNVDIRSVRFFPQVIGKNRYKLSPLILEDKDSLNINKGINQQYWLTIYVPEDAIAGEYFSKIILQADGVSDRELILKVKVLPFKLKAPDRVYGVYYHMDNRWKGFNPFNAGKHFIDMREHGLNSAALYAIPYISKNEGDINLSFIKPGKSCSLGLNELLNTYTDSGLTGPIVYMGLDLIIRHRIKADLGYEVYSKDYDDAFTYIVRDIKREQAIRQWPEFLFSPADEPAYDKNKMEMCKYYLQLLKRIIPTSKTYLTLVGKKKGISDGAFFDAWLDIRCYGFIDEKLIKETREAEDELWVYNGGSFGRNPAKDRFFYGFYAEKISADGVMQWVYQWPRTLKASPYTEMKYGKQGWYYTYPSTEGPLPTIGWEGLREGIDDAKYIYTLRCLIDEAKESKDFFLIRKAVEADEAIENILKHININFHAKNRLSSSIYDKWRWEIACEILDLQKLLEARLKN